MRLCMDVWMYVRGQSSDAIQDSYERAVNVLFNAVLFQSAPPVIDGRAVCVREFNCLHPAVHYICKNNKHVDVLVQWWEALSIN